MQPTLWRFVTYFLRLGALGFGGPVALANYMRGDLVEDRQWISSEEYERGLALAAACPGPLAYQLGVYCGYIRFGVAGGLATAVAFGLPPFLIVTLAGYLYVRFTGNWQTRALFYGIAPVVVALIIEACWNLGRRTLRNDRLAWLFAVVSCGITVVVQKELALMFIAAGILGIFVFKGVGEETRKTHPAPPAKDEDRVLVLAPAGAAMIPSTTAKIFLFFLKTGLLVFGSGLVIVPFLKTQVVDQYHWLTNEQFLDSVAIGMISPGPVVITATFVGYLLNGFTGAVAATSGIFSGPVLFTVLATPVLLRYYRNPQVTGFIRGVSVTVIGVLAGTTWLIARGAIVDWLTAGTFAASLAAVTFWKKLPDPLIILGGAIIGLVSYEAFQLR